MGDEFKTEHAQYLAALSDPMFGSPSRPLHVTLNSWDEETRKLEDDIRERVPFEGKWQSYIAECKLVIPEPLRHLFEHGGIVTVSTERHLCIYGNRHWQRLQRVIAKQIGLSPVHNSVARHIYSKMYRFDGLNEDGGINVPEGLAQYAGLTGEVAIIGMIYYAEIHDRVTYLESERRERQESLLEDFKKIQY